jgi:hypothetical protein
MGLPANGNRKRHSTVAGGVPLEELVQVGLLPAGFAPAIPTAATAVTAAAVSTTAAERTLFPRTRLVHVQTAPAVLIAVQSVYCPIGFVIIRHLDKSETPRATRFPICDQANPIHRAIRLKQRAHIILRRAETQISNKDILQNTLLCTEAARNGEGVYAEGKGTGTEL